MTATRPLFGTLAMVLGALTLVVAVAHLFGGPFAPQVSAGQTVGEIAGEIRQSAWASLLGREGPSPESLPWDIDRVLWLAAAIGGALSVVLAMVALVRHEPWRAAAAGATLGIAALTLQFLTWAVLVILGALILYAIISNMGEIFGL